MRMRLLTGAAVCLALLASFSGQARAEAEEVRVLIANNLPYEFIFRPDLSVGCPEEGEEFLVSPSNLSRFQLSGAAWRGDCVVNLTYALQYFTDIFLSIFYNPETGRLWARGNSPILRVEFSREPCLEGICPFSVLVLDFGNR